MVCSLSGVRGTQGAGVGHDGFPVSWLVDLMSARVHKADELVPPPSRAP